jgi:hypothetical protein
VAALSAVTPTNAGTVNPGAAVAASDTIATSVMGRLGCYLEILNGNASPDVMAISDAGLTPSGNALTGGSYAATVTNATNRIFFIRREQAVASTGLVTITHSVTATVTYKLYPVG